MNRAFLPAVPLKSCFFVVAFAIFFNQTYSQCANITLPVAEGFNSTTFPSCWVQQFVTGTSNIQFVASSSFPTTTPQQGSDYVNWNSFNYTSGQETRLVSPPITTTGTASVDISFYWYNENSASYNSGAYLNEGVTLQYSPDSITWTTVQFYPRQDAALASGTGQWELKTITLPAAVANQGTVYIGFNFHSSYGDNCSLDNLNMYATPACGASPTAMSAGFVTATSATAYWTDASPLPASGYNWVVVLSGAGPTGTPVASGTVGTGIDSVAFTGLSSSTSYDFFIQSNCGGASLGPWTGPVTFTTPCGTITLPLAQGFNSTTIPNCWSQQFVTGTSNLQYVANSNTPTTTPQEGTDYVYWNSYSITGGNETRLVSPPINSTGVPSVDVSFYWYNENSTIYNSGNYLNEGVTVQYSTNGTTWTTVQFYPRQDATMAAGTGQWKQKYLTLPAAVGNQPIVYVGFNFHSAFGDNCSFDHLNIMPSPACAGGPTAITASLVGPYTATISWTAAAIAPSNGYNWRIVAAGDSVNGLAIDSGTTLVDSALVTGLSPNTPYDIYVQSNCGGSGLGYWIGPVTFSTPCVAITSIPWTEGFEGLGTNVGTNILPPCWMGTPTGRWTSAHGPLAFPAGMGPRTGNNFIYGRYNANDTVFTPGFQLTGGVTYEFYYYYETDGYTGWTSITSMCGTSQDPAGMTTIVGTPISNPANTTYNKFVGQFTPPTTGTYYFGVNLVANFNPFDLAFDDFGLKIAPACAGLVSNETVNNMTSTSASLSWSAAIPAPSNGYNWELVATGDSVNGTVLFSGTTAAGIDSVLVNGLLPYTSYDLYVQTNCGVVGVGDWTGPLTFVTPCAAITSLPWHEGFESLGSNTGTDKLPPCWLPTPKQRWATSSVPLTFAGITPRAGTNFLYDFYNANDTVFTPGFQLTGGTQYEFYFYYQTDGRAGWDSIFAMYGNFQSQAAMTTLIGPVVLGPTNTTYQKYSAIFTPATSGTYYFGVRLSSTFSPNNIGFDDFGLQKVVPCPNPPIAGTIAGPNSACPGASVSLTLTGYSPYTTLQWQSSSDSINFSDIVGATQDYLNTSISSAAYFRVKVHCADSSYTAVFPIYLNAPIYCYCNNLGGGCGTNNIIDVSILNTNFNVANAPCVFNNTGAAYTQFPDTGSATTSLQRGGAYSLSINIENATISSAWIDYNQNGLFEPSEWVQITINASSGTVTLNIPANAVLGKTGFRVRTNYSFGTNGANNACTRFFDGETFDFLVTIVDSTCNYPPVVLDTVTNVTCHGGNNGSIALGITGSNGPYTSLWSTGDTTTYISQLRAGIYTDTISFNYGCTYLWHVDTVAQPALLQGLLDSLDIIKCFGDHNGAIYLTPTGGTPNYSNHWSTGETTSFIVGKSGGNYSDTITDASGCKAVSTFTITAPTSGLSVLIDSTQTVKCNGQSNGSVFISTNGGTAPFHYHWSNGSASATLTNVPIGSYTVIVTDTNGCTASASDSVSQPGILTITIDSVINAKCHNASDGSIYVHVTGGTLIYNYAWTGGANTYDLFLKPAGTYTLTITDANNCSTSATDSISAPSALSISSTITNQIGGTLGSISAAGSGGVGPYKFRWSNGDSTATVSNLSAGIYTVTMTDLNGCTSTQRDTVNYIINGISEINGDILNFNVYPNPSSGMINVIVELSQNIPVQLELYSITGQLLPVNTQPGPLANTYQLDLSDQSSGIYLVKLIAGDYSSVRRVTLVK